MSRRMANEFKPQMDGNVPQPKKRRKANANAANANAGNNTTNTPPTTNTNQNNTPPIGMPPQDLAPPPPISTFGDTIVASNPFDDTPPSVYQNGMMAHVPQHPHHAMRNDPSQYMQPPHYPNAHPMPTPPQRNMINPSMEPGYQMNNQQPSHVPMIPHPRNGSHPPMHMHGGPMAPHGNMQMNGSSALRSIHQMNSTFGLGNHMDGPMHNNRGMMLPGNGMNAGGMNAMNANTNSNMSSMNPLGQLAQMNNTPNSHLNSMNSPNGSRMGSSSPSLAVNSTNPMGLNGNRVPGSSSPHLGMNSPNPGSRLGNSPLNNLNAMNNMNAPSMGSPINQNPHVMKNNGQMCPPLNSLNSLNSPLGNVHPGQQMMPQQGPLPPPRGMNMANGSHGNPMNPINQNMMQVPPNQSPQQQMQSMHAQNINRSNMPISPISPMPPTTNSPLSSLSSMSPLSSLSSLSSMVGQPNQPMSGGPKNMNPQGMMNPHGPNTNPNMQPFQSPHHQLTPGMSPQGNTAGMKLDHMMMKLDQPGNFENTMMMKGDQIPSNPNFDTSGNMNMMKGDPMVNFDNPNHMMMNNVMKQNMYF
ncbi:protein pygopus isoform X2 [Sitodiplosis mosellana]|uniref:protein pygopus isoform X2 n=1 Tax=Sitodiplosis mosellana TaxID=263140 RepID=UPI0024447155|nr:protein pygopus isoform X2 [Sitodiplosis mosellana]XP_055309414.1 protein pygopus isoform X2 [Sitodiplosis mosellana]XP_055309415.1 protein pygopus isoform X2 [Sitodiplosis mosellana]